MAGYILQARTTVTFTADQLLALVLAALAEEGHEFDPKSVTSKISTTGLTLTAETVEGTPPKAAKKTRKPRTPKVAKEVETKDVPEEKSPNKEVETKPTEAEGNTPFPVAKPAAETIAEVKEAEGVQVDPPYSAANTGVETSTEGETPTFDFGALGTAPNPG